MDDALKALYYSVDDTGSYGGVERLYRRAVEARSQISTVTPFVIFFPVSEPTLSINPLEGISPVTVLMSARSTSSGRRTWRIWSDSSVRTVVTVTFLR